MPDDPDESFVINTLLSQRAGNAAAAIHPLDRGIPLFAPGDDAAMVTDQLAITVDTMVEGVHWDETLAPEDVGWKLVACNASDINAMGGHPLWAVISVALPNPLDRSWVESFSRGLAAAMDTWSIALVGGDTTRSQDGRVLSLTVGGHVPQPIGRSFAKPNQTVWVSGPLGGPAAAFLLQSSNAQALSSLRRPVPPIGLGEALGKSGHIGAMMDLSDGLARDLSRLCRASGVGAEINPEALPAHPALSGHPNGLALMTGFGEEYELLFTADTSHDTAIKTICSNFGRTATPIGRTTNHAEAGAVLKGCEWPPLQFSHFTGAQ